MNLTDRDICIGRGLATFRCGDTVKNEYLYYALSALEQNIKAQGRGTTFDGITAKMIRNMLIPLPPIEKQKRIIKSLDDFHSALFENNDNFLT